MVGALLPMLQAEINLLQHEIQTFRRQIELQKMEKDKVYRSVQDFTKADSVATDNAIMRMTNIDKNIRALERKIKDRIEKLPNDHKQLFS